MLIQICIDADIYLFIYRVTDYTDISAWASRLWTHFPFKDCKLCISNNQKFCLVKSISVVILYNTIGHPCHQAGSGALGAWDRHDGSALLHLIAWHRQFLSKADIRCYLVLSWDTRGEFSCIQSLICGKAWLCTYSKQRSIHTPLLYDIKCCSRCLITIQAEGRTTKSA